MNGGITTSVNFWFKVSVTPEELHIGSVRKCTVFQPSTLTLSTKTKICGFFVACFRQNVYRGRQWPSKVKNAKSKEGLQSEKSKSKIKSRFKKSIFNLKSRN